MTLTALLVFPSSAAAQWWLFPGSRHRKDTVSTVHSKEDSNRKKDTVPAGIELTERTDSILLQELPFEELSSAIRVALILPLKCDSTPSGNFLDFYSGVLMAVEELSGIGYKIDLTVEDCTSGDFTSRCRELKNTPIIIGPVNMEDINRCISILPDNWFISPLEPKAEDFVSWCHVIQTPTPNERQLDELVAWLKSDCGKNDRIVFLKDDSVQTGDAASGMILKMNEAGLKYEIASAPYQGNMIFQGTTRYVLISDDSNYTGDKVREIALLSLEGADVTLYSTSKIRSSSTVDVGNLHLAEAHVTLNYFTDSRAGDVVAFSERYRTKFKISPGMFAFHGYDTAKYFISMYDRYGSEWTKGLSHAVWKGLQSDFMFIPSESGTGKLNSAVRRIVYNNDNTITLLK